MKTLKIIRLFIIVISLSFVSLGFTLLNQNPDPDHCICDQSGCGTITCNYQDLGYSNYCQYKYYTLGDYWGLIAGSPCPSTAPPF